MKEDVEGGLIPQFKDCQKKAFSVNGRLYWTHIAFGRAGSVQGGTAHATLAESARASKAGKWLENMGESWTPDDGGEWRLEDLVDGLLYIKSFPDGSTAINGLSSSWSISNTSLSALGLAWLFKDAKAIMTFFHTTLIPLPGRIVSYATRCWLTHTHIYILSFISYRTLLSSPCIILPFYHIGEKLGYQFFIIWF